MALKAMTDSAHWAGVHSRIQRQIAIPAEAVLDAEKPREVIAHQEGVKVMRRFLAELQEPVNELQTFINARPLFAPVFPSRAQWNVALGRVEIKSIK